LLGDDGNEKSVYRKSLKMKQMKLWESRRFLYEVLDRLSNQIFASLVRADDVDYVYKEQTVLDAILVKMADGCYDRTRGVFRFINIIVVMKSGGIL
jgi:hypothetical protein